jgi:hypothetical protein
MTKIRLRRSRIFFVVRLSSDSAFVRCGHLSVSGTRQAKLQPRDYRRVHPRSANKIGGTDERQEHRAIPFVVGAGNADT